MPDSHTASTNPTSPSPQHNRAYIPDLINQSLGRGVYMCGYEYMKRVVREAFPPQEPPAATDTYTRRPQPLYQRIIAASVAGIAGWVRSSVYHINDLMQMVKH